MQRLITLAVAAAALTASACASTGAPQTAAAGWTGGRAEMLEASRASCRSKVGQDEATHAFTSCMHGYGWRRA